MPSAPCSFDSWIADDFGAALQAACRVSGPIATLQGEVFHGLVRVEGGARAEARGILTTKREIKELRERAEEQRLAVERLRDAVASLDLLISSTESAILALQGEQHRQEKATVGFELQSANACNATERVSRKREQISNERRTAEEELRAQDARQEEAQASIASNRNRPARRGRAAERCAAAAVRCSRTYAGAGHQDRRGQGDARRAGGTRERPERRGRPARRGGARSGSACGAARRRSARATRPGRRS